MRSTTPSTGAPSRRRPRRHGPHVRRPLFPPEPSPPPPPPPPPPPSRRAPRTRLAVGLQLGRMFPPHLTRRSQQSPGDREGARRSAEAIAHTVLDGARERSGDPHRRPLLDQQARTES